MFFKLEPPSIKGRKMPKKGELSKKNYKHPVAHKKLIF